MKLDLPKNPVDGFEVFLYVADVHPAIRRVRRLRYVYHVNTPWKVYDPESNMKGADLVDDWMCYSESKTPNGRLTGWSRLCGWLDPQEDVFISLDQAVEYLTAELQRSIDHHRQEIVEIAACMQEARLLRLKGATP